MSKRSFPWPVIAIAAVAGASFAGIATYVQSISNKPIEETISVTQREDANREVTDKLANKDTKEESTVRTVRRDKNEDPELGSSKHVPKGANPKVVAINEALVQIGYKGIRTLEVSVRDGNAILDMNSAVQSGFGSSEEADFIEVLKTSLSQFKEVKTFQIRVEGRILDTLGHFEIIEPVSVR